MNQPTLAAALMAAAKAKKTQQKFTLNWDDLPTGSVTSEKLATPSADGAVSYGGGSIGLVLQVNSKGQITSVVGYDLPLDLIDKELTAHKILIGDLSGASAEAAITGGDVTGVFSAGDVVLTIGNAKVTLAKLSTTIFNGLAAVTPGVTDYLVIAQNGTGLTKKALVGDLPTSVVASAGFTPAALSIAISPAYAYGHAHLTLPDVVGATGHNLATGQPVISGTTVNGLTAWEPMYLRDIDGDTFYLYDTLAHAQAGGTTGRVQFTADLSIDGLLYYTADMSLVGRNVQGVFMISEDMLSGDAPEAGHYLVHLTTALDSATHPVVVSATGVSTNMLPALACGKCLSVSKIRIGLASVIGGIIQAWDPQECSMVCL